MSTEKAVRYTSSQMRRHAEELDVCGLPVEAAMLRQAAQAEADVAGLVEAASKLALSVADETEALRAFKCSDGEGMAACKIAESRVVECTEQLQAALARFQQ